MRAMRKGASASILFMLGTTFVQTCAARAQLLGEPALPAKVERHKKQHTDLEWLWQYGPPPSDGREHELIQDAHFQPFLEHYLTAPQSFWGPQPEDPRSPVHKSLAATAYDFLAIPGKVLADENRYITVTGSVFHRRTSRGMLFADLNTANPLVVFAAIEWIRDAKTTDEPDAEYTVWIFPNQATATTDNPDRLPAPLMRSLIRWMAEPLPGSGNVQHVTAAILVMPDGTPHQIAVPGAGLKASPAPAAPTSPEATPILPRRQPS